MMAQVPKVDALQGEPWGILYGYPVAAKTGTAQVADTRQCKHHTLCQYGSSYIGIAPAQDPKLVVAVNVQDPTANGYYGDEVAGPVFYNVMKFALQTMKIPPDARQAALHPAHAPVIGGNLSPCQRLSVPIVSLRAHSRDLRCSWA